MKSLSLNKFYIETILNLYIKIKRLGGVPKNGGFFGSLGRSLEPCEKN
jgi:hypothetical protein